MFSKILIANRGEIAVRVIRACREMGIATVAVYSEADKNSLHAALADERVCVGPAPAGGSYLNIQNIVSAALVTGAGAVHPGYGFLSENPDFAQSCADCGLTFIGPPAAVIRRMGDKDAARRLMEKIGVPTAPGSGLLEDPAAALAAAEKLGYPLLVKAAAGGGGKGIRLAQGPGELENAFLTASGEARKAFGIGAVFLERFLSPARHVEVQVLADGAGRIVCLGERDCSLQLGKQKVLEETPSPAVGEELRRRMQAAAVLAARAAGYINAGTVEFLLDENKNFYFIEMNTRLQVEHRITEEVSGIDLVKWQIRLAAGLPLPFAQEDVKINGCAMECRINARTTGTVDFLHVPGAMGVGFDTALVQGGEISPYYDAMLGKLIACAPTREEAIRKMESALGELVIGGVETNIEGQLALVRSEAFRRGEYDTGFLQRFEERAAG